MEKEYKIGSSTDIKVIIDEIIYLFQNFDKNQKIQVRLLALNTTICKVVLISVVIKSRLKNIHQIINLGSLENSYDIDNVIPTMEVILSNTEPINKDNHTGYTAPYTITELYKLNTIKKSNINFKVQKQIKRKDRFDIHINSKRRILYGRIVARDYIIRKKNK